VVSPALTPVGSGKIKKNPSIKSGTFNNQLALNKSQVVIKNATQGGSARMPSSQFQMNGRGGPRKEDIAKRLKKKSPWFESINRPKENADVKIPDSCGIQTGTQQIVITYSQTVNAGGVAGCRILTPYPNSIPDSGALVGTQMQFVTTVGTASNLAWGATGAGVAGGFNLLDGTQVLRDYAQGVRVVSASVTVRSESSTLNNEGEYVAYSVGFGVSPTAGTVSNLLNLYNSARAPINGQKPLKALWYPLAQRDPVVGTMSYVDFVDPKATTFYSSTNPTGIPQYDIGAVVSGGSVGSTILFEVCVNYEFIPEFKVLDIISVQPSREDPQEESLVLSWMEETPKATVISDKEFAAPPLPSKVDENPTGFGMFADVVSEILPYAASFLPLLL